MKKLIIGMILIICMMGCVEEQNLKKQSFDNSTVYFPFSSGSWWNSSYTYRRPINCSNMDDKVPLVINGSGGFDLGCGKQIVWTYCSGTGTALYYNNCSDYVVANDTDQLPMEVELGNGTSYNPSDVWNINATYHFNTNAKDSAGNYNGTTHNFDGDENITGKFAGAFHFEQSNKEYIDTTIATLNKQSFTVLFWMNTTLVNYKAFCGEYIGGTGNGIYFRTASNGGDLVLGIGDSGFVDNTYTQSSVNDGNWHQVGFKYDGSTGEIIWDGGYTGVTVTKNYTDNDNTFIIGSLHSTYSYPFDGGIDEFRIYNYTLSASELSQTYQNAIGTAGYGNLKMEENYFGDYQAPSYSDNSTNTTQAGEPTEFRVKWTDNYNLSGGGFIFYWHNGTNWTKTSNSGDLESGEQSQEGEAEEDFEGSFPPEGWQTGGDANWFQDSSTYYSGSHSAASGDISHNQKTWLKVTKTFSEDRDITFYWKVSSENNYDWLCFCVDKACGDTGCTCSGYSGTADERISGSVDWTQVTHSVSAGTHTFTWCYKKDVSVSSGSDMGWIDLVGFGSETGTEANKTPVTYSDTITDLYETIHNITVTVYVSYYNNSGSQANGNTNPTLWLEVYNGTDWVDEGNLQVTGTGNYSKTVTTTSVLEGWETESNRDIRISARYMDYSDSSHYDTIKWNGVWVEIFSEQELLNDSFRDFNSTNCVNDTVCWSNVTKTVTSEVNATIKWKVKARDQIGNWNETPIFSYQTTGGITTTTTTTTSTTTVPYNPVSNIINQLRRRR